nr:glutamate receptor ionotropic, delta-2-like [Procambarus clarkii]
MCIVINDKLPTPVEGAGGTEVYSDKGVDKSTVAAVKATLVKALGALSGNAVILLVGEARWVTHLAILVNKERMLGPNNVLMLHPTSGSVDQRMLVPRLRLAAKVLVLERQCSASVGGQSPVETDRRCVASLRQAVLLPAGGYDLRNFIEAIRVGPGRGFLVGYLGEVINALAGSLDFRVVIMEGSGFGSETSNGSYDGVVGHIERQEGDVGLASLSITFRRSQAIDYTSWLVFDPTLFVTRGPSVLKDHFGVFKLYTVNAWCAIAGFVVFSTGCLWLLWAPEVTAGPWRHRSGASYAKTILRWEHRSRHAKINAKPSFFSVLSTVLKAFINQGSRHPPPSLPGRHVMVSAWLSAIIVCGVYNGNLTAFLSTPVLSAPPTTIHQLVARGWSVRLDKAYGGYDLIKDTKTEDYRTLYQRAEERGHIIENTGDATKTNFGELLHKDIAYVMGAIGAYYTMSNITGPGGRCVLAYSKEPMALQYAALALPKKSLLKPLLDRKLRWMRQMGILRQYNKKYFGVKCHQWETASSEPTAMTLEEVGDSMLRPPSWSMLLGVFYVWAGGAALSFLVFLCELCARKVRLG